MLQSFRDEFTRYRLIGERALAQMSNEELNRVPSADGNSAAMIVRHISGNLVSRFTDFLTSDGEKPWRGRDEEFEYREYGREEVDRRWADGWSVLEAELSRLEDADLAREVRIRDQAMPVHAALARSLAHAAYHVGQIVLLARISAGGSWEWISIPKRRPGGDDAVPFREEQP